MLKFVLITIILLITTVNCRILKNCVLSLRPEYTFFTPLIFTTNGTLISTENFSEDTEDITIANGHESVFSCTPNYFRHYPEEKVLRGVCNGGNKLLIHGKEKDFKSQLSCEVRSIEEIITPVTGCPSNMRGIEYGYTNPITLQSFVLGEACYDTKVGRVLFVHTKFSQNGDKEINRLALKVMGKNYFQAEHPTSSYKIEMMKAMRYDLLKSRLENTYKIRNPPSIGAKRYLNEDLLTHKQYQTLLKLTWNYAILYDDQNSDNFDFLQNDISQLDDQNIEIYAGSYGVLNVKNSENNNVDIFMKDEKFPVPKFNWFVIRSGPKATAFIIYNNLIMTSDEITASTICESKCEKITWITTLLMNQHYKNKNGGYILCCDSNELNILPIPQLKGVTQLYT